MEHETLWSLLKDPNHWIFEIVLMILFDGLIGMLVWPWLRGKLLHHQSDDKKIERLEQQVRALQEKLGIVSPEE
jgi:hypothetical protein